MNKERQSGFYRVKNAFGDWIIASYQATSKIWSMAGVIGPFYDRNFQEINKNEVSAVPVEDEWVSVEDRLPEKNQYVDIFQFGNRVPDVQFEGDCFYDNECYRRYELKNATHWRALPQPPSQTNKPE